MEYKGFDIKRAGDYAHYSVTRVGAGAVPVVLSGYFTTESKCKDFIDMYTAQLEAEDTRSDYVKELLKPESKKLKEA